MPVDYILVRDFINIVFSLDSHRFFVWYLDNVKSLSTGDC